VRSNCYWFVHSETFITEEHSCHLCPFVTGDLVAHTHQCKLISFLYLIFAVLLEKCTLGAVYHTQHRITRDAIRLVTIGLRMCAFL